MLWHLSHSCDRRVRPLADRHYNRQKPGSSRFVPPGRCLVLRTAGNDAVWATSWPFAEFVKHRWAGAWVCSLFRNESAHKASELIEQAVGCTRCAYGMPPPEGFVTFLDRDKVRPTMVRGKKVYGWTWLKAGWQEIGETGGGLLVLGLNPTAVRPSAPHGWQNRIEWENA